MTNQPQEVLEAIKAQLSQIRTDAGYSTNIGAKIILRDTQRSETERPSIAIGTRSGTLDRTGESAQNGQRVNSRARRMDVVIEAGVPARGDTAQALGLQMLEDIERAWAVKTCGSPLGVTNITLSTWSILDRPEGIDAVVLQILGNITYLRQ